MPFTVIIFTTYCILLSELTGDNLVATHAYWLNSSCCLLCKCSENGIRLSEIKHVTDESNDTFAIEASISIPATACLLKKHQGPFFYKMLHRNFPTFDLRSFLKCAQLNGFRSSPCKCPQLMSLAHKRARVNVRILYTRIPNTCSTLKYIKLRHCYSTRKTIFF